MAKRPSVPTLASEILDLRYRLITREQRIEAEVYALLTRMIDEWEREVRRIIGGPLTASVEKAVVGRRAAILSSLRKITKAELRKVLDLLQTEAAGIYRDNAYRVASVLAGARAVSMTAAGVSFSAIDTPAVKAALAGPIPGLSELRSLSAVPARVEALMRKDLAGAIADGYRVDQLVAKWKNRVGAGAVSSEVRALARTSVMSASNNAHLDTYLKNKALVPRVRWEATFDRRTCVRCGSLHGREFAVDDAPPIPGHMNCRCVLLPVFSDQTLNAAVHGVGAYQSPTGGTYFRGKDRDFEKFLRSRTPDFRADFFPSELKRRAFESGRLGLADLVSRDGSIKTDDEVTRMLRRRP